MKPEISIVIATYNHDKYLQATLESISSQVGTIAFDVILIDDGSTDSTERVAMRFPFVRYEKIEKVSYNPAHARNVGLKLAETPIIIQQSDEVLHVTPNTIKRFATEMRPGHFQIALLYMFNIEAGTIERHHSFCAPFFYLGAAWRSDIYLIGGYDEDFVTPGYDDHFHADCLIRGINVPVAYTSIVGLHQQHPVTDRDWLPAKLVYDRKLREGVFCASGGPWPLT